MGEVVPNTAVERLSGDLRHLHEGLARWSVTRWGGRAADGRSRGDVLFALVGDIAVLAEQAGCGAPPGVVPPRLEPHALPDQLIVVGSELVSAPRLEEVASEAEQALSSARRLLLP